MKIRDVMTRDVQTVTPDQTAQEAAAFMLREDAGSMPVSDGGKLIGMITDRDITIRGIAKGCGPETPVRELMTDDVVCARIDDDVEEVAIRMSEAQVLAATRALGLQVAGVDYAFSDRWTDVTTLGALLNVMGSTALGMAAAATISRRGVRSAPATRSGRGLPSHREAHTSGWPSHSTRSASHRIRCSSGLVRACTW